MLKITSRLVKWMTCDKRKTFFGTQFCIDEPSKENTSKWTTKLEIHAPQKIEENPMKTLSVSWLTASSLLNISSKFMHNNMSLESLESTVLRAKVPKPSPTLVLNVGACRSDVNYSSHQLTSLNGRSPCFARTVENPAQEGTPRPPWDSTETFFSIHVSMTATLNIYYQMWH